MFSTSTLLICLLVAAVSGLSGFFISYRFWRSQYAATNKSGYSGSPNGGAICTMSGVLIGVFFIALIGKHIFPAEAIEPAQITGIAIGAIAGFAGGLFGIRKRK